MMNNFKAGAARMDITPPLGTLVNGDFIPHYAHTIHDPLFAKALVLQKEDNLILFIVVDTCLMKAEFHRRVKKRIKEELGIDPQNIMISATHTHGAGAVDSILLCAADLSYRHFLQQKLVRLAEEALQKMRSAKIAYGKVNIPEHVVCRRYYMEEGYQANNPVTEEYDRVKTNPGGLESKIVGRTSTPDPEVSYLAVKDLEDRWISVFSNYSLHYVGDWDNGTITADYFGVFAAQLRKKLNAGDDFIPIMTNGTSGDVNIVDFIQPDRYPKENFKKSMLIGEDVAQRVFDSLKELEWEENPEVELRFEEKEVPIRKPSDKELSEALEIVKEARYENLSIYRSDSALSHSGKEKDFRRIYAREQVMLSRYPDTILFPVQALRIGSGIIGALGGEFFAETGLWLKKNSGTAHYFTICLANSYVGYVPPQHEYELGGYETWRCQSSFLALDAEEKIRECLLSHIKKLIPQN